MKKMKRLIVLLTFMAVSIPFVGAENPNTSPATGCTWHMVQVWFQTGDWQLAHEAYDLCCMVEGC